MTGEIDLATRPAFDQPEPAAVTASPEDTSCSTSSRSASSARARADHAHRAGASIALAKTHGRRNRTPALPASDRSLRGELMPHHPTPSRNDPPDIARTTDRATRDDEAALWECVRRLGTTDPHNAAPDLAHPNPGASAPDD